MIADEQNVINEWKNKVNLTSKYNNEFLKTFVGELLEYISNIKDQEQKHILFDFIEKRKNFTSKTKVVIINYLKYINIQQNEYELKKKFKLYIDLGSESREKIATLLKKKLEQINNIRIKDKQIIAKDESHKEIIDNRNLEISNLKKELAKLRNTRDNDKSKYLVIIQNLDNDVNSLREENEKLSKENKNLLLEQNKILKMQLNHNHKQ
tara:strand:+ start:859 stop:1485 length:627 start_codon:yes stop_codon:yes gene_type:complete